jgi:hypothetical protein
MAHVVYDFVYGAQEGGKVVGLNSRKLLKRIGAGKGI